MAAASRVYRDLAAKAPSRNVRPRFLVSGGVAYRSPFYAQAFKAALDQTLFDVREHHGSLELETQLNGLGEAVELARRLSNDETIPTLDGDHPSSRFR